MLVAEVLPDIDMDLDAADLEPTGRLVYEAQADRWAILVDLFKAGGAELFFNGLGGLVGRPEPDVATSRRCGRSTRATTAVLMPGRPHGRGDRRTTR